MHELGEFVSHYDEIRSLNTVIVALSVDPLAKARLVKQELRIPFPVLSDSQRAVLNLYGTGLSLKVGPHKGPFDMATLVLIDKSGTIRWIHVSTNYKVRLPVSEDIAQIKKIQ
ncbi:MAG: peroxiredoxin family protein [Terriglobia bacterium]